MRQNRQAFTLIELAIAVFILLLILMIGVPSMNGLMADRRLHRSLDEMNRVVREAQARSVAERRPYLLVWGKDEIILRPEAFMKGENADPVDHVKMQRGDAFKLELPAALKAEPPPEWIFWPSGVCEPARVKYSGTNGSWVANFSPLTARATIATYAAK